LLETEEPEIIFPSLHEIYHSSRQTLERLLRKLRRQGQIGRGGHRRASVNNSRVGRSIRPVLYKPGRNTLAPTLTLLSALQRGRVPAGPGRIGIDQDDLMGWDKAERESMTLILLVDTSRSSYYYIEVFRQILGSLSQHFQRKRDRMGLIVLQGRQAVILNHPTHNFRVVSRSMAKLRIHGESPLADGLQKALAMARIERYRNPGSLSLVVLLSDCFPEPLLRLSDDLFEEPAYRNALSAAYLYKREKVNLLVINPSCAAVCDSKVGAGETLSERIASRAGGRLIKIHPTTERPRISSKEMATVMNGIESAFHGARSGAESRSLTAGALWIASE
jgi:Mg-chelatase subunit ChlD